ncbi:TRAP transporter small permease [Pontiella sp.]|uniref:TRAP transporter small permease n=1 Tax=Pontiella sp. TaxID=2837462 RepID=UPI00356161CA
MLAGLVKIKEGLTKALNAVLIVTVALLVLDVCWGVFTRYVMGEQAGWTEELARFLLIWVALLGGAVAFGTKGHLGVDYFVGKFHPETQKLMAVVSNLIVLFFAAAIFVFGGSRVVADTLTIGQVTPALQWKMGYVYLALPISGIFMVIYTVENLIEVLCGKAGGE